MAWGFQPPPLDRIANLDHELKTGEIWNLSEDDLQVLRDGLLDYPDLAAALLSDTEIGVISAHRDGWVETPEVTIVRTTKSDGVKFLELDLQTPNKYLPVKVTIRTDTWKQKLHFDHQGLQFIELPPPTQSELITLDFKGKELRADPSILRTRVAFLKEKPQ